MSSYLLALNCGSSSLKTTLFSYPSLDEIASISASSIGSSEAVLKSKHKGTSSGNKSVSGETHSEIFGDVLQELKKLDNGKVVQNIKQIKIVTHRIVHGGTLTEPVEVSKEHTEALDKMMQVSSPLLACHSLNPPSHTDIICLDHVLNTALRLCTSAQSSCRTHCQGCSRTTTRCNQLLLLRYLGASPLLG